jgi:threonine dehydrogenase-like Zn-dependent dehydrogenase
VAARLRAYAPRRTLVTGAGPIGLFAAMLARQSDREVSVYDRIEGGTKPQLVRELGARYFTKLDEVPEAPEVVIECTGAAEVVLEVIKRVARNGIVCLAGLSSGKHVVKLGVARLNDSLVLENEVVFGSVNANMRHYEAARDALARAPAKWLERILHRRVPLAQCVEAYHRREDDVKVIVDWTA